MKNQVSFAFLLFILCSGVIAQTAEKTVERIRKQYTETSEKARLAEADDEQGEIGELFVNEIVVNKRNHQWRAVGIFGETYKFFYRALDSEKHLYPDQLVMVKVERRSSSRSYAEEYLYDAAGKLIFYFIRSENDEMSPGERRVYFDQAKPVRIIEDGTTRDRLTAKDLATAREIAAESGKIKDIFGRSTKL